MIQNIKSQKLNDIKLVEILFYAFPLCFIIGNLAVSLNTLLFIIVSLFVIKKEGLNFRFKNSYWLLISFFLYFFLSTTIQFLSPGLLNESAKNWSLEINPIFKSLILVRFLILIFVIDILLFNKVLNLKKFCFLKVLRKAIKKRNVTPTAAKSLNSLFSYFHELFHLHSQIQ